MKSSKKMLKVLRLVLLFSCLINGLFAGENVYSYVIEVPAWKHLDIVTWAEYCRHADMGNGIFLFPLEAALAIFLSCVAAIITMKNKDFHLVAFPVYATALFVLTGGALTFFAAPQMLQLRTNNIDKQRIQLIFDTFHYWGKWRAAAQILSFITNLLAVARIYSITIKD